MDDSLQQGIALFKSGNKEEARKIFISFVKKNPQSEQGWQWMYNASLDEKERMYCLKQILRLDPGNQKARKLLDQLAHPVSPHESSTPRKKSSPLATATVAALAAILCCAGLVTLSTRLVSYKGNTGSDCLIVSLNGKEICYPSQGATQTVTYTVLPTITLDPTGTPLPSSTPTLTFTPTVTFLPTDTATSTFTFTPTLPVTATVPLTPTSDRRLGASFWRKWPIVPAFSPHAQEILRAAIANPNLGAHTFSKIGDCQMTAGNFLGGYANGNYKVPAGYETTVQWFSQSMLADDMTAVNGYGINTVLNPSYALPAGYTQCLDKESPVDCELRTRRPAIVLIGMGTNWIPHGEASFEKYLRTIVDKVLATGALPILATKADNVEGDWKLNQVIAQVAYDYDLPLVNVWLSVQKLPNQGLEEPPRQVYLTGDGWMKRNEAWLATLDIVRRMAKE